MQLETADAAAVQAAVLAGWRARIQLARAHLGWTESAAAQRHHVGGVSLAFAAPCDQLFVATEVNEWALCAELVARDPRSLPAFEAAMLAEAIENARGADAIIPPVLDEAAALARFSQLASREALPALRALLAAAAGRSIPHVLDDDLLTLGAGTGGKSFPLNALPATEAVPWQEIHDIPTAVVTGSNGKTTTVRLLAACARAQGWPSAFCCTDGVFFDNREQAGGDYSGPEGARRVLREPRAQAAVIETARGGMLRRGLALFRARVAVVTNVSADHFGEYGIDDLPGLADVKLTVGGIVAADGLLVLNADDAQLIAKAPYLAQRFGTVPPLGWFALDADHPHLRAHRERGGDTCGVSGGRLVLHRHGRTHDLGAITAMPLTIEGRAIYNVANLAGAALAAAALGVAPERVAAVCATFGSSIEDNSGRMMRFERNGVQILVDYAHNPEGMRGLLGVATHLRRAGGRLGTLLGHAGNRQDSEIEALAEAAVGFHPDLIVVKESETFLRGRAPGEIPQLIHAALRRAGVPEEVLPIRMTELAAVECALEWARPGDVLALPVHSSATRAQVLKLLQP